jgi:predicted ATPase
MHDLSSYQFATLWEDGELALSRGTRPGGSVLAVTPTAAQLTPRALARLQHAYAIRDELDASWAARPIALVEHHGHPTLLCEDPGVDLLARQLARPQPLADRLRIAIAITVALRQLHARRIVHKDLKPSHLFVGGDRAWLTGFGIASRVPRERQAPEPPEVIAGTLAYMAPEQTGRMNRSIDARADLYALGVTLYELFGGALPFTAREPMEWIHCHIARPPAPLTAQPPVISALVLKLLAKAAEDRYQTAAGVEHDLRRALAALEATGRIERFALAAQDASDRLLMPERLIGRDAEIAALSASFEQVVADGAPRLVLVAGYSGIGKSSLVNELHRALVPTRGLFAAGKFDQYQRDIPYATLARVFGALVAQTLGKSELEICEWRGRLLHALGAQGQLIIQLVPELALVIGPQPAVAELGPKDAQARFQAVVRRFLAVFASADHPLVVFLDDLQWLDGATLEVLEHLLAGDEVRHLLVVGAYRDNEAGPALIETLARLRRDRHVRELVLGPLGRDDVVALCAEALHATPADVAPLAELVFAKSGGNPFFTFQLLTALVDDQLVVFEPARAAWRWDLEAIRARGLTDNVVELMTQRLDRLPAEAQRAARLLACVGNTARLEVLRVVLGADDAIHAALAPAVAAGLVHRSATGYAFLHDRIQEAAYAAIPPADRPAEHLRIGRALERAGEQGFEVVNHLNLGAALIETQGERDRVAELNRQAGARAKASTANAAAYAYAARARALLGADGWTRAFRLAFDTELLLGECELLVGDLEAAERRLDALRGRAEAITDRAAVIYMMTVLYTAMAQRTDRAIEICLDYLRRVGIDWPAHPGPERVQAEYQTLRARIAGRSFADLLALPLLEDPERAATIDVLLGLMTPAFNSDPNLVALVLCRIANLALAHGHTDAASLGYAFLGMIVGCVFRDFPLGYQFGALARDLVETRGLTKYRGRIYHTLGTHVLYWTQPLAIAGASLYRGLQVMQDVGDVTYVGFAYCSIATYLVGAGKPLAELQAAAEAGLAVVRPIKFDMAEDMLVGELQLARTLRGEAAHAGELDGRAFAGELTTCWFLIRRLQACVVLGDAAAAVAIADRIEPIASMQIVFFNIVEYHFYAALARAALGQVGPALAAHRRALAELAEVGRDNLEARLALVDAELARLDDRALDAMAGYERAIQSARAQGFLQISALAFERAGRFYAARGLQTIADALAASARSAYLQWGATAKVKQLEGGPIFERRASLEIEAPATQLDLAAVVKSSQAVSAEVGLDQLVRTLMTLALEHAGANRGLLVLAHHGALQIAAEASVGDEIVVEHRRGPARHPEVPEAIVNFVARTRELVLVPDAREANQFSADPYLRDRGPRSAVAIPLVKQGALVGMLYLENTLAPNAFTSARIAVLKLLASQAATSLQNASLEAENASLTEKEALLKEVHHRVKNNLQLISSLLSLQSTRVTDPAVAELFSESRNRVRSMALVHENLYRAGNLARISMELHVRTLVAHLRQAYGLASEQITLETRVSDVHLDMSRAVTCGLIINELVSNALKHAFPGGRPGRVWIELAADDQRATLVVGDDGRGLPAGFDLATTGSLGLQLISDLTAQLHGTVALGPPPGTSFTIAFPTAGP